MRTLIATASQFCIVNKHGSDSSQSLAHSLTDNSLGKAYLEKKTDIRPSVQKSRNLIYCLLLLHFSWQKLNVSFLHCLILFFWHSLWTFSLFAFLFFPCISTWHCKHWWFYYPCGTELDTQFIFNYSMHILKIQHSSRKLNKYFNKTCLTIMLLFDKIGPKNIVIFARV